MTDPTSYKEAVDALGNRDSRKLGNNTYLERIDPRTIGVLYHRTYVVRFHLGGRTSLTSGGWRTYTTKERINRFLPRGWGLWQKDHVWYIGTGDDHVWEFEDGDTIDSAPVEVTA